MKTVRDVMSSPVKSLALDTKIDEVIDFFKTHKISGAPVVNKQGFAMGIISRSDLFSQKGIGDRPVQDFMTPFVFEVSPDDSLLHVARSMVAAKVHRIVALEDSKPVGIVTSLDLVKDYVQTMESQD